MLVEWTNKLNEYVTELDLTERWHMCLDSHFRLGNQGKASEGKLVSWNLDDEEICYEDKEKEYLGTENSQSHELALFEG